MFRTEAHRIEKELQGRYLKREEMHEEALNKVEDVRKDFQHAETIRSKASRDGRKSD
jgi:hypothetical protein